MNNVMKITALLAEADFDAIMLTTPVNRLYATGFESSAGVALITPDYNYFFTDFRYIEAAGAIENFKVTMVDAARNYNSLINSAIEEHNIKKLAFEDLDMSVSAHKSYAGELKAELVGIGHGILGLRSSKEEWELERMRAAQAIAERALDDVLGLIKPGMTEKEVAAELIYHMLKYGADGLSFSPIVVSGKNSSMPHGVPGDKKIEDGDFITMDFGCIYRGYCSDMTRTVAIGYASPEMRKVYQIVLDAQTAGIEAFKAGVIGKDVDGAARKVIADAGYGDYFGHGFGHSLGIEIHEPPNASAVEQKPLPVGAVVSAEPGIYLPGKFGVRIEDVVVVTHDGCENITKAKKDLIIL